MNELPVNKIVPLDAIKPHPENYNAHPDEQIKQLGMSYSELGQFRSVVLWEQADGSYIQLAGHGIVEAMKREKAREVRADVLPPSLDPLAAKRIMLADNLHAQNSIPDDALLAQLLQEQADAGYDLAALGTDDESLRQMLEALGDAYVGSSEQDEDDSGGNGEAKRASLAERFIIPPFSVLDARQGYWQERKRAWIALGIQSELGRGENLIELSEANDEYRYNKNAYLARIGRGPLANQNKNGLLGESEQARSHYQMERKATSTNGRLSMGWTAHAYDEGGPGGTVSQSGTSIFDPVICELAYRWFCPPDGLVLDPFAGGSVRGIVAAKTGRRYLGIDLRAEQIAANEEQAARICVSGSPMMLEASDPSQDYTPELTPVMEHGGYLVKRDDLFQIAGVRGGKVRTVWALAQGAKGLVTSGSRHSPHVHRVAAIAQRLGIPCHIHIATGENTPDVQGAEDAGAEIIRHKAGYLNVLNARAREDAEQTGYTLIPFGVVCDEAVRQIKRQTANLPQDMKRLVVAVGSGVSLSGILQGLKEQGRSVPVLGVSVGKDPTDVLDEYAPKDWRKTVTLVKSPLKFEDHPKVTHLGDIPLDPTYEAKCLPYLQDGDVLWSIGLRASKARREASEAIMPQWIVGDSRNIDTLCSDIQADLIFTCPPYYDLEVYSDNPDDLSTASTYADFLANYRDIFKQAIAKLRDNRFVCVVVGDIRDKKGFYRNFVNDTIAACQDAGARLYNEAILVTSVGSLPIRVGKQFSSGRKLGKTHQNVLVFCKGDPVKAVQDCGPVVVEMPEDEEVEPVEEMAHA